MQDSATGPYQPLCLKYEMKPGAKQYYDEKREYLMVLQQDIDQVDPMGPFFIMYLTEAGTPPYHCNNKEKDGNDHCAINATTIYYPGFPSLSIAQLSIEYVKDLREDSEATFVPVYKYSMWNKMNVNEETGEVNMLKSIVGFQYGASPCARSIVRCRFRLGRRLITMLRF